ncbi:hypothetical protein ACFPN0_01340 [Kitasatospora cinereorecta]
MPSRTGATRAAGELSEDFANTLTRLGMSSWRPSPRRPPTDATASGARAHKAWARGYASATELRAFLLSYRQRDDLNRAYERLVERCMRERGAPVKALTHVRPPLKDFLGRRYGLTDLEQAEQYG